MNRNIPFTLLVVAFLIGANIDVLADKERLDRIRKESTAASKHPRNFDPHSVDADIREDVLADLRRLALFANSGPQAALLHIMDSEFLEIWKSGRYRDFDAFVRSGQPRLVPLLIDSALEDEGIESYAETVEDLGDVRVGGYTSQSLGRQMILGLLKNCAEVPADVRVWASATAENRVVFKSKPSEFRKMMTEWWAANQEHFEKERFDLVRPGAYLSNDERSPRPAPPTDMSPLSSRTPPQPETAGNPATPGSTLAIAEPAATGNSGWYYSLGGAALLAAVALLKRLIRKS